MSILMVVSMSVRYEGILSTRASDGMESSLVQPPCTRDLEPSTYRITSQSCRADVHRRASRCRYTAV